MGSIDLHIHSSFSDDGELLPKDIITESLKAGVRTLAIADHNTTRGVIEAQKYLESRKEISINLIPAIELDCSYQGINLHVLGYKINPCHNEFLELEKKVLEMEQLASTKRVQLVEKALNVKLDLERLYQSANNGVITGEIIAEELLANKEFTNHLLLKPYRNDGLRSDNPYVNFYWDYCSQGKEAYVHLEYISLDKAVEIIHNSGGVPVLAHPGNNIKEDINILVGIINKGVIGVEAISSYHKDEQISFYMEQAKKLNLAITCGSDFHGKIKPSIKIGVFKTRFDEDKIYSDLISL